MKKIVLFCLISLMFMGCQDDPQEVIELHPSLMVQNDLDGDFRNVIQVNLVGYEFGSLDIRPMGGSQTFVLDQGMAGGYDQINVDVKFQEYQTVRTTRSIKVDFVDGQTTRIRLYDCVDGIHSCGVQLEEF